MTLAQFLRRLFCTHRVMLRYRDADGSYWRRCERCGATVSVVGQEWVK